MVGAKQSNSVARILTTEWSPIRYAGTNRCANVSAFDFRRKRIVRLESTGSRFAARIAVRFSVLVRRPFSLANASSSHFAENEGLVTATSALDLPGSTGRTGSVALSPLSIEVSGANDSTCNKWAGQSVYRVGATLHRGLAPTDPLLRSN
jgi:hypothetical protein